MNADARDNSTRSPPMAGQVAPVGLGVPVLSYARPDIHPTSAMRDGRYVVLPHGMMLPDRCVKCGAPADLREPVTFHFWLRMSRAKVNVPVCKQHARNRSVAFRVAGGLLGLAVITLFLMPPAAALLLLVAWRMLATNTLLRCRRCNTTRIWLSGADESFLAYLPPVINAADEFAIRDDDGGMA